VRKQISDNRSSGEWRVGVRSNKGHRELQGYHRVADSVWDVADDA
jgi:hypothetical protein